MDKNAYAVMNFCDNEGYVLVRYHIVKINYNNLEICEKINYNNLEIFKKENILKYFDDIGFLECHPTYREIFEGLVNNSIRRDKLKKIKKIR